MKLEDVRLLKMLINQYKDLTVELINFLEMDKFEDLERVISERQQVITKISDIKVTKEAFKELCDNINLLSLEKKVTNLGNEKKVKIKNEIKKLESADTARKNYNKNFTIDPLYFNKKV